MRRSVSHCGAVLAILVLSMPAGRAADSQTAIRDAAASLASGDFVAAEQQLRAELRDNPDEIEALALLGAALDGQKKSTEAEEVRGRAQVAAGRNPAANYAAGMALANAGQFDQAESFLARALAAAPDNFGVLYNLGVAATFAGHHERAREVLETALRQQPQNVDVLYSLAYVNSALKQRETAVRLLAQAAQLDPGRADIQKLLAITTGDLGALADSLAAWERYVKLAPDDDFGRRERGFALAATGQFEPGIAELEGFLARHPGDSIGHYELALAQMESEPVRALAHLDRAVALKADFVEARSARGSLYYRQGKPESALADLEFAARLRPGDPVTLDRLGQTYLALDRPADAVRVLHQAAAVSPDDSRIQLHYGRALADAGQAAESKAAMDRFRQLGPEKNRGVPAGLVDYLSLTPEQQRADYRARVEKAVADHPEDAAAEARYLQLLLDDGKTVEAVEVAGRIAGLKPDAAVLADAGRTLLEARQYAAARELLGQAAGRSPSADVRLNLALAAFYADGAADGLRQLDRVPEAERGGDFYLARAQMLDAAGKSQDAARALEQALRAAPTRSDLYLQAAALLAKNGRADEALRLLDRARPDREILLAKATTMELAGQTEEAGRLVNQVQDRWPEWHAGWVAQGIVLESRGRYDAARQALETSFALGAHSAEAWYALADCSLRSAPERIDAAAAAIRRALELAPEDPWVQSLAGRVLIGKRQYAAAVERLREAIRLRPGLIPALESLAEAYGALGRKQEAAATLELLRNAPRDPSGPREIDRLFLSKPPRDW